jgi:AraC-like DNA-binding protein
MDRRIPPLAFNDSLVPAILDFNAYRADRERVLGRPVDAEPLCPGAEFGAKASRISINGLGLVAKSHSPVRSQTVMPGSHLWILQHGGTVSHTKGGVFRFDSGDSAYYASEETQWFTASHRSTVGITLDQMKLSQIMMAMSGAIKHPKLSPESRTVQMNHKGVSFACLFQGIFNQIDALNGDKRLLELMRLDDSILRLCAALLYADQILGENDSSDVSYSSRHQITNLCEALSANLTKPFSLTQMEQISGLAARVLQYSFQKQFGCRPKEWLRKQRLHAARAILQQPDQRIKLASLAYDFCFPSPSVFARYYQAEFGELPSETLARKKSVFSA